MVCLKSCHICGIAVLDDDLCPDCMKKVSICALNNEKINKEIIKEEVISERLEKMHKDAMEQLKAMTVCPSCGHNL